MKCAIALLLSAAAQASVISTTSVYCVVDGQRTTAETKCSEVGPTLWDRVEAEGIGSATISGNTLTALARSNTSTFASPAPSVPLASGGEASVYVGAATEGPERSGWARVVYYDAFGYFSQPTTYRTKFDGAISALPELSAQHLGKLGSPTPVIVPFQLGTTFNVRLHVISEATFGTGGIFHNAWASLELFEDQALTTPVPILPAPEPSTWLLVSLPLLFALRNRLGRSGA